MKTLKLSIVLAMSFATITLYAGEMDGEWVTVSKIRGGSQEIRSPAIVVIKKGKIKTVRINTGRVTELGNISELTSKSPNQYNIDMSGGDDLSGKSFHGIFSISGDTLFTCVNPEPSGERPTEFKSTKENGNLLVIWIRKSVLAKLNELANNSSGVKTQKKVEQSVAVERMQTCNLKERINFHVTNLFLAEKCNENEIILHYNAYIG